MKNLIVSVEEELMGLSLQIKKENKIIDVYGRLMAEAADRLRFLKEATARMESERYALLKALEEEEEEEKTQAQKDALFASLEKKEEISLEEEVAVDDFLEGTSPVEEESIFSKEKIIAISKRIADKKYKKTYKPIFEAYKAAQKAAKDNLKAQRDNALEEFKESLKKGDYNNELFTTIAFDAMEKLKAKFKNDGFSQTIEELYTKFIGGELSNE